MKEEFTRAEIEIIIFETEDVITTSSAIYDNDGEIHLPEHEF
ncbi:MAG: hypothetical protein SOX14_07495 [Ruminococcus callidus]|nr:hypothetical protein [Ruminococcus callidus]